MTAALVRQVIFVFLVLDLLQASGQNTPTHPGKEPAAATSSAREEFLRLVQKEIQAAVTRGECPGAVFALESFGSPALITSFGHKVLGSSVEVLDHDTIFDAASLTKCVVSATLTLRYFQAGHLSPNDRVTSYLQEFRGNGKENITIDMLLRHRSGLIADNPFSDYLHGEAEAWRRICALDLKFTPGESYLYTDVGFIVLGKVIEHISGLSLDEAAHRDLFLPLGMSQSGFRRISTRPSEEDLSRFAPTEPAEPGQAPLRGIVHDPRARKLDGVAGHAGLFTSARDLLKFAAMLRRNGRTENGEIYLSPRWLEFFANPGELAGKERRSYGFDMRPAEHWSHRPGGQLFPLDGFGHTGFTGTSFWFDPRSGAAVILLASRLYPDGRGDMADLRRNLGDMAAKFLPYRPWMIKEDVSSSVATGIDQIVQGYRPRSFAGRRLGLITNHTGRGADGRSTIDLLAAAKDLRLTTLFSPEHGLRGALDEEVPDEKDASTGLPVYSLYGKSRAPDRKMMAEVDTLVFDIQDIGTRFYTYISTLVLSMRLAAEWGTPLVVLDRPNPISGRIFEGPILDPDLSDFVGIVPIPIRHGLTVGELARLVAARENLAIDLEVVPARGLKRSMYWDETGLPWVNPSPNMRSLTAAILYPGIGLLETTNVSVGRGTPAPFEVFGAPWIDSHRLLKVFEETPEPGLLVRAHEFTPTTSVFAGELCHGLAFEIKDRNVFRPLNFGFRLALLLQQNHPDKWTSERYLRLLKHRETLERIRAGEPPADFSAELAGFVENAKKYWIYD